MCQPPSCLLDAKRNENDTLKGLGVKTYAAALRNHWRMENCLHWQLDVTFGEDASRMQKRHGAENFALLRRLALALLKRHPAKGRLRTKRYRATLDVAFLEEILKQES
ncbi:MAG: transposase [Gemmataceae bacterium]